MIGYECWWKGWRNSCGCGGQSVGVGREQAESTKIRGNRKYRKWFIGSPSGLRISFPGRVSNPACSTWADFAFGADIGTASF